MSVVLFFGGFFAVSTYVLCLFESHSMFKSETGKGYLRILGWA
jgi:predicted MFS family arabinose efflux permease